MTSATGSTVATNPIFNGFARAASSIAAVGLHTVSGAAGAAKIITAAAGALITTAITVDSIQYYQFGINNMPEIYSINNCGSPAPTLLTLSSRFFKELDCYDPRKTFPEYFQLQALLFPVTLAGLTISHRIFSNIESGAKTWGQKYANQWTLREMLDTYELRRELEQLSKK